MNKEERKGPSRMNRKCMGRAGDFALKRIDVHWERAESLRFCIDTKAPAAFRGKRNRGECT
jgi:hypothetical protein